jgi:dTDP-4-dehydrorhamnose reductase
VNPAAFTAVDRAEDDFETAYAVNAVAPAILAEEAKKSDAVLVHYSTDYVFDGKKRQPYTENDPAAPETVYGQTKLAGEMAVSGSGVRYVIIRLSWVYATHGDNFLLKMVKMAKYKHTISIVCDQYGAPSWARMIADATARMVNTMMLKKEFEEGIFHMSSAGITTWYEYARTIFDYAEGLILDKIPVVQPVTASQYQSKAKRPEYSVMSGDKLLRSYGVKLSNWKDQLKLAVDDLFNFMVKK